MTPFRLHTTVISNGTSIRSGGLSAVALPLLDADADAPALGADPDGELTAPGFGVPDDAPEGWDDVPGELADASDVPRAPLPVPEPPEAPDFPAGASSSSSLSKYPRGITGTRPSSGGSSSP